MATSWRELLRLWFGGANTNTLERCWSWMEEETRSPLAEEALPRLMELHNVVAEGQAERWRMTPRGTLAYIIALDQLSRRLLSDSRALAYDRRALSAAVEGLARGFDQELTILERVFFYMPFMHAENLEAQHRSVALYSALLAEAEEPERGLLALVYDVAIENRVMIERWGRFPGRNQLLGRSSTPGEASFNRKERRQGPSWI